MKNNTKLEVSLCCLHEDKSFLIQMFISIHNSKSNTSAQFFVFTFTFVEMQEKFNTLWIKLSAKLYQLSYRSIDKTLASCLMFRTYGNNITYHIHFRFYIRQARIIHTVSYFHKSKKV